MERFSPPKASTDAFIVAGLDNRSLDQMRAELYGGLYFDVFLNSELSSVVLFNGKRSDLKLHEDGTWTLKGHIISKEEAMIVLHEITRREACSGEGWRPWNYTSDYTKNGLVLSQGNGRYSYGQWTENKTGTVLAGAAAGGSIWYLSGGWGLSDKAQGIIGMLAGGAGLTNLRYETRGVGFIVDQTTWYGTITHNMFTGNIVGVNDTGLVTNQVNLVAYGMYQERIIYTPTNTVIATRSHSFGSGWQGFSQPAPSVGMNLYDW
jgi:hypothetical protein